MAAEEEDGKSTDNVWAWTPKQVSGWVKRQGKQFKKIGHLFEKNNVCGSELSDIDEARLSDLGVKKKVLRVKLYKAIGQLRRDSGMIGVREHKSDEFGNVDNTNVGTTDKAVFGRLYKWLTRNGADLRKVYFDPKDRILRVRKTIAAQERILTVPPKLFLSTTMARTESKLIHMLQKAGLEPGTHTLIAVLLLEEVKKEKTFWQPYLDVLPKEYGDIPIFWSDEEKKELQGDAHGRYLRRKTQLEEDYNRCADCCPGFSNFATLEEFMWARTAVITRTFGLRVDGVKITANLPIDFLMHSNVPDTTWGFDQENYCYHITAVREIPQDKFLTITYGRKANARFLINYGFCLENNSRNKGFIAIPNPQTLANPDLPENVRLPSERYELSITDAAVTEALKSVRVATNEKAQEFSYWDKEKCAVELLHDLSQTTLDGFATPVEADRELLKTSGLSGNVRNALLARLGEKDVLDFYRQLTACLLRKIDEFLAAPKSDGPDDVKQRNRFFMEYLAFVKKFTSEHTPG